jgi:hypothetical protein
LRQIDFKPNAMIALTRKRELHSSFCFRSFWVDKVAEKFRGLHLTLDSTKFYQLAGFQSFA